MNRAIERHRRLLELVKLANERYGTGEVAAMRARHLIRIEFPRMADCVVSDYVAGNWRDWI